MYETGLLVAVLLWTAHMVHILVKINSQMERNLNRMGRRFSWVTSSIKEMDFGDVNRSWLRNTMKYFFILGISIPFVLASWLYVALVVGEFLYRWSKDSGAPQNIKEYRWKLKNCDLSFDQMIREGMKVAELDPDLFEQTRMEMIQQMQARGLG